VALNPRMGNGELCVIRRCGRIRFQLSIFYFQLSLCTFNSRLSSAVPDELINGHVWRAPNAFGARKFV
jgi:hypothetical protein